MESSSIKLQILSYIKANIDNRQLVSYASICKNVNNTTDSYVATALNRLINERLVFHLGRERVYGYGITAKGLEYLKACENRQEISKLTLLLKRIAGLT
jgi:predicted transcriptional regulator